MNSAGFPRFGVRRKSSTVDRPNSAHGFTLVEMVVVTAVALVLLAILIPVSSALWSQRRVADAENTLQGLLHTTRARAMKAGGSQTGLFFFIDEQGRQRVVSIEQPADRKRSSLPNAQATPVMMVDVFRVSDDREEEFPPGMRVVPTYIVKEPRTSGDTPELFSNSEVAVRDFPLLVLADRQSNNQRHKNFFSMIHSADGQLLLRKTVVIQDEDANKDGLGDRTGLRVGNGQSGTDKKPEVSQYYPFEYVAGGTPVNFDPEKHHAPPWGVDNLIADVTNPMKPVAINFPSVDGLLVYDESVLSRLRVVGDDADGREMRAYLRREAQPFYVSRHTGAIIRGPIGEN